MRKIAARPHQSLLRATRLSIRRRPLSGRGEVHDRLLARLGAGELAGLAALRHDQDAVGEEQELGELGADHEDGEALGGQGADEGVDLLLGADVDAAGRLVEEEDARAGGEPLADDDLLLVAAGEGGGGLGDAGAADAEAADGVGRRRRPRRRGGGCRSGRCAPSEGSATLSRIESARSRPSALRSSVTSAMPRRRAARGEGISTGRPSRRMVPAERPGLAPKRVSRISVRPEPRRPPMPRTSPWWRSKSTPCSDAAPAVAAGDVEGEVADGENAGAGRAGRSAGGGRCRGRPWRR